MTLFKIALFLWILAQVFYFGTYGPDLLLLKSLAPHRLLFGFMLLSFLLAKIAGKAISRRLGWPECLMFTVTGISLLSLILTGVARDPGMDKYQQWLPGLFNLTVFPYAAYLCVRAFPYRREFLIAFLKLLCLFGIYLAVTAVGEHYSVNWLVWPDYILDPERGTHFGRARGPFMESVAMGRLLTVAFGSWLVLRSEGGNFFRTLSFVFLPLTLASLYFTETRGPWIGCALLCLAFIVFRTPTRKTLYQLTIVVLLVASFGLASKFTLGGKNLFLSRESTVTDRVVTWLVSTRMIEAHPIFGLGYGHFYTEWVDYFTTEGREFTGFDGSHNTFLTMAAELGLPALLAFLGVLFLMGRRCLRVLRRLGAAHEFERNFVVMALGLLAMYTVTGWFSDLRWNSVQNTVMFVLLGIVFSMDTDIVVDGKAPVVTGTRSAVVVVGSDNAFIASRSNARGMPRAV